MCYTRLIRKLRKNEAPSEADRRFIDRCLKRINELTARLDTLAF
jgi:ribosome assembly protein YihI (activator of Der GTPase)